MYLKIFILLWIVFCNRLSMAQDTLSVQDDPLIIQLVTVDPGDELTMWWGHTGILVADKRFNSGAFYNYGLFSFEQDNFITNFARGRLIFWVGVWDAQLALNFYKSLNRTIRIQTFNLPAAKKRQMAKILAENVLPENREYLYDHYFDNCATRVRDLINQMTGGALYEQTKGPGRMTLREHTRRHTDRNYFMDWLLMFLMNDTIDQPIRAWDEMFLPTELERNVAVLQYPDSSGNMIHLVSNEVVYFQAQDVYIVPENAPVHWPAGLITGLLAGGLIILASLSYCKNNKYPLGIILIFAGIIFGIPGLALFLMSLFTDHIVTYHNENLFLANPLTLVLTMAGYGILRSNKKLIKLLKPLTLLLFSLAILLLPLKILPMFDQNNWLSIVLFLPIHFALMISSTFILSRK